MSSMIWSTLTAGGCDADGPGADETPATGPVSGSGGAPGPVSEVASVGGPVLLLGGLVENAVAGADTGICEVTELPTDVPLLYMPGVTGAVYEGPVTGTDPSLSEWEDSVAAVGRTGKGDMSGLPDARYFLDAWWRNIHRIRPMMSSNPTTPPTTPPAMAPACVGLLMSALLFGTELVALAVVVELDAVRLAWKMETEFNISCQ